MKIKSFFCFVLPFISLVAAPAVNAATLFTADYNSVTRTTVYDFSGTKLSSSITGNPVLKNFLTANLPGWGPGQIFANFGTPNDVGFNISGNDLVLTQYGSSNGFSANAGDYLLSASSSLNGGTLAINEGSARTVVPGTYDITVGGVSIGDFQVTASVPEPGISALLGLGCIFGVMVRRRRRNA